MSLLLPRRVEKGTLGPKIRFEVLPLGKGLITKKSRKDKARSPRGILRREHPRGTPETLAKHNGCRENLHRMKKEMSKRLAPLIRIYQRGK